MRNTCFHRECLEVAVGALVVVAVGLLAVLASVTNMTKAEAGGYLIQAHFHRIDGLTAGAEVTLAGTPVGRVADVALDEKLEAEVTLRITTTVPLPTDTTAAIKTRGLLGGKFVSLAPGGALDNIPPGGRILYTQDSLVLEDLLQRVVELSREHAAECRKAMAAQDHCAAPEEENTP